MRAIGTSGIGSKSARLWKKSGKPALDFALNAVDVLFVDFRID
jgi:hypothetical protein